MKASIIKTIFFGGFIATLLFSCSSDDEPSINATEGLTKISEAYAIGAAAKVEIWAAEELFAGYNPIYLFITDSLTGETITDAHITLSPLMTMATMSHSCPVEATEGEAVNDLFPAAILFSMASGEMGTWSLEAHIHNHLKNLSGSAAFDIEVKATTPSKVSIFQSEAGQKYYLSYMFSKGMKVGVNDFEVVAYTMKNGEFVPVETLSIEFTPEMPAMDHGSPNNVNPAHMASGHYMGKANFTMTGEWRLNLALTDGETSLGTRSFDIVVE
ncbi:MAG: FixH family protein [Imperialibacter sp.]|uniref:FixH family protein n=1 Tax=Imperialibacter sp. TaxID=2038411 RepID=UPI0032EB6BFF